jgi:hypothetical protein
MPKQSLTLLLAFTAVVACRHRPAPPGVPVCVNLSAQPVGPGPNPVTFSGVTFQVSTPGGAAPATQIKTQALPAPGSPLTGLDAGFKLEIKLPGAAKEVSAELVHFARPAQMRALDSSGAVVGTAVMTAPGKVPQTLTLAAPGIASVVIVSPSDEVLLLQFCYTQ